MRSSSACSSATCASSTSVLVATPTLKRSATTRRASAALRTPSSAATSDARAESRSRRRCADLDGDQRVELGQPLAARGRGRSGFGRLPRPIRPPSQSVQFAVTPTSHDSCHVVGARKDARVRIGVVGSRAGHATVGLRPASTARRRSSAATIRSASACRSARRLARWRLDRVRRGAAADAADGLSSRSRDLDLAGRRRSGGADLRATLLRRFRASISCSCCRDRCASALETSLGGIRPCRSWPRTSRTCASARAERLPRSTRSTRRRSPAPSRRGSTSRRRSARARPTSAPAARASASAARCERIGPAAGVDRPLKRHPREEVVGNVRIDARAARRSAAERELVDVIGARVAAARS